MLNKVGAPKLERKSAHAKLLLRDLACEVIQREKIETTLAKAKEVRRVVERMIEIAKRGVKKGVDGLEASKRVVFNRLRRKLAVAKIYDILVDRYKNRRGGYTRVIKIGRRKGDGAKMAIIELVKEEKKENLSAKKVKNKV
jgi:large subunit ribosomal protein L17